VTHLETSLRETYLEARRLKLMDNPMGHHEDRVEPVMEETFEAISDTEEISEAVVELVREAAGGMTAEIEEEKLTVISVDQEMTEGHHHFGMIEAAIETAGIEMIVSEGDVLPHPRDGVGHPVMALGSEKPPPI
jgi:hypothetical protein